MSTEASCMHPNIFNSFYHKYKRQSDWDGLSATQKSKYCQVLQEQQKEQAMEKNSALESQFSNHFFLNTWPGMFCYY